jgi:hypothetical protein
LVTVGVTGHRAGRLANVELGALQARLGKTFEALAGLTPGVPRLATSLAEGVDRLAAEAALELGYELLCPLPFAADDYERDFSDPASVAAFRRLLASAAQVTTMALPAGAERASGYTAAGRAVLTASDVLVAVWDGEPARGEGGTGQMVEEASARALPVVWLGVDPPHALRLRPSGGEAWLPVEAPELAGSLGDLPWRR